MITLRADERGSTRSPSAHAARPRPVFVVDDDAAALRLLGDVAEGAGLEPQTFTTLGEVRAALREVQPEVVLLDDDLPDGRGGDLARELTEDPATRGIRVVVCTAADLRRRAEIGEWAPVLAKPFDVDELERLLRG